MTLTPVLSSVTWTRITTDSPARMLVGAISSDHTTGGTVSGVPTDVTENWAGPSIEPATVCELPATSSALAESTVQTDVRAVGGTAKVNFQTPFNKVPDSSRSA